MRSILAAAACLSVLPLHFVPVFAQGREVEAGEASITVSYSTCLAPATPQRIALTVDDQASILECKKWSTFQRAGETLDTRSYLPAAVSGLTPVNAFLRHVIDAVYRVPTTTYVTDAIYDQFRNFGWHEVPRDQSKLGALMIWPGMAAVVASDVSEPGQRVDNPLAGLFVIYPSEKRNGKLSIIDAGTLHAGRTKPPRFIVPISPIELFWNSWVEQLPTNNIVPDFTLVERGRYRFLVDLARFDYAMVDRPGFSTANEATKRYVDELTMRYGRLRIVMTLLGSGLAFVDDAKPEDRFVDRTFLDAPPSRSRMSGQPISAFAPTASGFRDDNNVVRPVSVTVEAIQAGCHGVAFSIWTASMDRLLDYVIRPVIVTPAGANPPPCPLPTPIAVRVDEPRLGLLSIEASRPVDATLQLFERKMLDRTLTALVYTEAGQDTYSWSVQAKLADVEQRLNTYLTNPEPKRYLREIGDVIRDELFTAQTELGQNQADAAFAALRSLASRSPGRRPALLARFANTSNQLVFIPIHLVPTDTIPARPLGAVADVLQPMPPPLAFARRADACLDSLSFLVTAAIPQSDDVIAAIKESGDTAGGFKIFENWDKFVEYVKASDPVPKAEGLVIVAHHGNGLISFNKNPPPAPISKQTIRRQFGPGSFAVLAACAVANVVGENSARQVLDRLNDRGIAAAVVAPFNVPEVVAAQLVTSFGRFLAAARMSAQPVDVAKTFRDAIEDVARDPGDPANDRLGQLNRLRVWEFMLVGDGSLAICRRQQP